MIFPTEEKQKSYHLNKQLVQKMFLSLVVKHTRIRTGEMPYHCDICNKKFIDKSVLAVHMGIHTGEKPYQCDECSKMFVKKSELGRHKTIHTGEKSYQCDICNN